jgi:hypothetical protein
MVILLGANISQASERAYKACDKLAVQELRLCLNDHGSDDNQHCWTSSHQAYSECAIGLAKQNQEPRQLSKEELRQGRKLDKKIKAEKIRSHLMAAATIGVYQQVIENTLEVIDQRLSMPSTTHKQKKRLKLRSRAYRQFLGYVENKLSCQQLETKLRVNNQTTTTLEHKVQRELIKHLPSYCRL